MLPLLAVLPSSQVQRTREAGAAAAASTAGTGEAAAAGVATGGDERLGLQPLHPPCCCSCCCSSSSCCCCCLGSIMRCMYASFKVSKTAKSIPA